MKRVWIGAGIGVVLIAFSIFSLLYSIKSAEIMEEDLQLALNVIEEENWDFISQKIDNVEKLWKERRPFLNTVFHHDPLESIEITIENLRVLTMYKNSKMFHVKCSEAIQKVKCLRECDQPRLENIL